MKQSISDLGVLTGIDRKKIKRCLANLPHEKGPQNAHLYETKAALPLLYLGDGESHDLTQERARLAHHQANIADLDERVRRGDLLVREEVVREITQVHGNFRAKMLNIAPKLSSTLVAMGDVNDIEDCINDAVYEALEELHNQYAVYSSDD